MYVYVFKYTCVCMRLCVHASTMQWIYKYMCTKTYNACTQACTNTHMHTQNITFEGGGGGPGCFFAAFFLKKAENVCLLSSLD